MLYDSFGEHRAMCLNFVSQLTHYNTLQHNATHRNTLQHTATHCTTLHQTATHGNTLQRTAIFWTALHHSARTAGGALNFLFQMTHWDTLKHTATYCNTLQHTATHCNILRHTATHCNTVRRASILRRKWSYCKIMKAFLLAFSQQVTVCDIYLYTYTICIYIQYCIYILCVIYICICNIYLYIDHEGVFACLFTAGDCV